MYGDPDIIAEAKRAGHMERMRKDSFQTVQRTPKRKANAWEAKAALDGRSGEWSAADGCQEVAHTDDWSGPGPSRAVSLWIIIYYIIIKKLSVGFFQRIF